MADLANFDSWLNQLECPESCSTDYVKQRLQKGILGLIWEEIPRFIRPFSEVSEIRKNILLYKIKNEPKDSLIQSIRNIVNLRNERKKLNIKIESAEKKWHQQEFVCRQKAHLLEKKKEETQNLNVKTEIFKIKNEQMLTQITNCKKMQEICHHLMPASIEEVSESMIVDCLSLVSNYSGGPEKRKVWNTISETLSPIKIPVLWNALMTARSHYTDLLIHLDTEENEINESKTGINLDIGTAKICGEHLHNVSKRVIHAERMKNNEMMTMEYVEKIEQIIESERPELNEWLPLALEVRKLEILQTELQRELEKLEKQLPVDNMIFEDFLIQLINDIKNIDSKTADCVQEIQNSFGLLKSSRLLITKTKESFLNELEKFQLLQNHEENQWLDIDLNTELMVFNEEIDINALRKIMLKGETGIYKHLQMCFDKASIIIDIQKSDNISNFPMIRVPIYYLVDLYKTYTMNLMLNKQLNETVSNYEDSSVALLDSSAVVTTISNDGILELLRTIDIICRKTLQHSEEFEQILKTWSTQSMRETVLQVFDNKTVDGATLEEWQKRFSMIIYVLQKSNINVA